MLLVLPCDKMLIRDKNNNFVITSLIILISNINLAIRCVARVGGNEGHSSHPLAIYINICIIIISCLC